LNTNDGIMRIAYLINQYPKVSHSFIRREIVALERYGFEIDRIALRGWDNELVDEDDRLEQKRTWYVLRDGVIALTLAMLRILVTRPTNFLRALALACRMSRGADRPLRYHLIYLAEACRIEARTRTARIKHVHAHFGSNPAEVAMLVNVLGGPPWSFTAHGPEEFDKAKAIGLPEKLRRCCFAVAISSFGRSQLYRNVESKHWSKIYVVHCGLERAFYDNIPASKSSSRRLVCVGRLCEQKGQLLLIEAAGRLLESGLDFELVLAGDGELRTEIETLIEQLGLTKIIRITGWISSADVRNELLSARALVLPSFAEGLPVVIMEAMSLKRPVISTFVAGIPELVHDGQHGWLVPAGDLDALVGAMKACLDASPTTLEAMGTAAQAAVLLSHDIDTEVGKLKALFASSIQPIP
jgi:colanic acid/amylovoran biosynthesis glycosyltransferase